MQNRVNGHKLQIYLNMQIFKACKIATTGNRKDKLLPYYSESNAMFFSPDKVLEN